MRRAHGVHHFQALLVASCLVASMGMAGDEPRRERVTLSVEARPREEAHRPPLKVWPEGGVLSLRVVDPGRLVVSAGARVLVAGALGFGEDGRLRVEILEVHSPLAFQVVSREPGRGEVELHVPEGVGAGGLLTLTYAWDWKHAGKPALVRTWRLPGLERELAPAEELSEIAWWEETPEEPEEPPEDEEGVLAFLSAQPASFPVHVDAERPELLWVPAYASREELASRLFGDSAAPGAFDFEPLATPPDAQEGSRLCVRVHHPEALRPELLAAVRRALDAQLKVDVAWVLSLLRAAALDRGQAQALGERSLRWAQRSELLDGSGQSYFDRYLDALAPWGEAPPRWHLGDTRAQDWHFLGEASEPLQRAIALRSKRYKTGYTVTNGSPVLASGEVVGRFYFPSGASVQVYLQGLLIEETTLERAELRVRNLPRGGPRLLIPGGCYRAGLLMEM